MGTVIPWPNREHAKARSRLDDDGERGRIFLFLGVRYERHDEPTPAPEGSRNTPGRTQERRTRARRRG